MRFLTIVTLLSAVLLLSACSSGATTPAPTAPPAQPTPAPAAQAPAATTAAPIGQPSPSAPTAAPSRATTPASTVAPATRGATPAPVATKPAPTAQPTVAPASAFDPNATTIRLERVVSGLNNPTTIANAGDGSNRLFVLEKGGAIRIVKDGAVLPQPFLDITNLVYSVGTEQGLLGLAFAPDYRTSGVFYVYYIAQDRNSTLVRYTVSDDPNRADPASAEVIFTAQQPSFPNHKGGELTFGPDGYLYLGLGDGGGAGDPAKNAQNLGSPLGKILRFDVGRGAPYAIPADNPFKSRNGARPEIWAYGLRNPWRFSFDRATGDLYIADVGQNVWEEINVQPRASKGGENYGWNRMEGNHCFPPDSQCQTQGLVRPVAEYNHSEGGCSVTGGFVYRGAAQPALSGAYILADYCTGKFWALSRGPDGQWQRTLLTQAAVSPSSFGEDEAGEMYVVGINQGELYRILATPRTGS
ncbi:MAG: PQQ-dependent sugar dehydrogenase [Anaerolineae bacterium]